MTTDDTAQAMQSRYTRHEVRAHRRALINALRSGRYKQTQGKLRRGRGYCCLGVVEDLRGCAWIPNDDNLGMLTAYVTDTIDGADNWLSPAGEAWLGVKMKDPFVYIGPDQLSSGSEECVLTMAQLNDRGVPFATIADVLEQQNDDWDGTSYKVWMQMHEKIDPTVTS